VAEITWSDGKKEFLDPPAGETQLRAPTGFEKYRQAREDVTAKPLKLIGMPEEAAKGVAQFLTPQTPAEQGIEVGTLLMPGAGKAASFAEKAIGRPIGQLAERGIRYAAPAIGGFVGDVADRGLDLGHNLYETARGALYGAAGDLLPFARGLWGRGAAIEKADASALGKAVSAAVPPFGTMETKADLDAIGVRGRGVAAMRQFGEQFLDDISKRLQTVRRLAGGTPRYGTTSPAGPGVSLDVPSLAKLHGGGSMTVSEAKGYLDMLGKQGWTPEDQLATGLSADQARRLRDLARKEIVSQLDKEEKGLGAHFDKGLNTLAKGHFFSDVLGQPGVIKDGKLDMNALRDVMTKPYDQLQTYGQRLEKIGSPEDVKRWYDALTRGSGDLVARDVHGGIKIGAHFSGLQKPHAWTAWPQFPKHVGEVPPVRIGPGGTPIARGLMGLSQETARSEAPEE